MDKHKPVDEVVDEGVRETFPASDPVAAAQPPKGRPVKTTQPPAPARRSPDWMFEKK
jgi:hypothetical protein